LWKESAAGGRSAASARVNVLNAAAGRGTRTSAWRSARGVPSAPPVSSTESAPRRSVSRANFSSEKDDVALTATSDRFTEHTWAEVGVDAQSLAELLVGDFEVVGLEQTIPYTADCVRTP
jgi:hypothetical protein